MTARAPAVIFDVDGTLINVSSVRYHVDLRHPRNTGKKDFHRFHEDAAGCPTHPHVVGLMNALRPDVARIVVTARMRMWEKPTVWSLLLGGVERIDHLFMRRDGDTRPDFVVKQEILEHIETRYDVRYAVDDNPNVIALWRGRGIPTVVVPGWEG